MVDFDWINGVIFNQGLLTVQLQLLLQSIVTRQTISIWQNSFRISRSNAPMYLLHGTEFLHKLWWVFSLIK